MISIDRFFSFSLSLSFSLFDRNHVRLTLKRDKVCEQTKLVTNTLQPFHCRATIFFFNRTVKACVRVSPPDHFRFDFPHTERNSKKSIKGTPWPGLCDLLLAFRRSLTKLSFCCLTGQSSCDLRPISFSNISFDFKGHSCFLQLARLVHTRFSVDITFARRLWRLNDKHCRQPEQILEHVRKNN